MSSRRRELDCSFEQEYPLRWLSKINVIQLRTGQLRAQLRLCFIDIEDPHTTSQGELTETKSRLCLEETAELATCRRQRITADIIAVATA